MKKQVQKKAALLYQQKQVRLLVQSHLIIDKCKLASIQHQRAKNPYIVPSFSFTSFLARRFLTTPSVFRSVTAFNNETPYLIFIAPQKNNIFITFTDFQGRVKQIHTAKTLGYANREKRRFFVLKEVMHQAAQTFYEKSIVSTKKRFILIFNKTAYLSKANAVVRTLLQHFKQLKIIKCLSLINTAHAGTRFPAKKRRRNK